MGGVALRTVFTELFVMREGFISTDGPEYNNSLHVSGCRWYGPEIYRKILFP